MLQPSLHAASKWIIRNTLISNESLTPELKLRLITIASPLWMSTPDLCPLPDPYWAFYWPGGQGLSRYILDNKNSFRGSSILDFGTGCGSASMAASICGARKILANDIDKYALLSTKLNFRLNNLKDSKIHYSARNFLDDQKSSSVFFKGSDDQKKYILLGDMFYDSDFAEILFKWLKRMQDEHGTIVLVGDPDRHPLVESDYLKSKFISTMTGTLNELDSWFIDDIRRLGNPSNASSRSLTPSDTSESGLGSSMSPTSDRSQSPENAQPASAENNLLSPREVVGKTQCVQLDSQENYEDVDRETSDLDKEDVEAGSGHLAPPQSPVETDAHSGNTTYSFCSFQGYVPSTASPEACSPHPEDGSDPRIKLVRQLWTRMDEPVKRYLQKITRDYLELEGKPIQTSNIPTELFSEILEYVQLYHEYHQCNLPPPTPRLGDMPEAVVAFFTNIIYLRYGTENL
ncbi:hypothetical protein B9Z55_002596 [Caenorhabditis nigoni]|uniref:ETFB lysine methyltransferase n=1 Tax=Caenorhabditis nigoni TaxID=1611254 RepID=A0A2G5VLP7_9PELO|nr:hypothetical protein B9Z55_002596 [Caenorhabditis nigoni]